MKLQVGRGWSSACMQPLWGYSLALLPAEKPDSCWRRMFNLASIERHANTKHFSLWKTFQEKIFCISISTAKKNFCQVMNLLMSQERCSASLDRNDSKERALRSSRSDFRYKRTRAGCTRQFPTLSFRRQQINA
jgi:hypothetical protein